MNQSITTFVSADQRLDPAFGGALIVENQEETLVRRVYNQITVSEYVLVPHHVQSEYIAQSKLIFSFNIRVLKFKIRIFLKNCTTVFKLFSLFKTFLTVYFHRFLCR